MKLAGAVAAPADSPDFGVAWHFGDPSGEQASLAAGEGSVDLSHRGVLRITGEDRLTWLNSISSQKIDELSPRTSALNLILTPHGHVEHELHCIEDGEALWLIVEGDQVSAILAYLESMKFMAQIEIADVSKQYSVIWEPTHDLDQSGLPTWLMPSFFAAGTMADTGESKGGDPAKYVPKRPAFLVGREVIVPAEQALARMTATGSPAGSWALEALRTAAAVPRFGFETDHRTLPHEVGWLGAGVHLEKGCYRGQEAVARVHNLGRPPRCLVMLYLDGIDEELPKHGATVTIEAEEVGWIASTARHFERGPIATAVLKSKFAVPGEVDVENSRASVEPVVVI